MNAPVYNETDFQDYSLGIFEGDEIELRNYLQTNVDAQQHVAHYQLLNSLLKAEQVPTLPVDFTARLTALMEGQLREKKIELRWRVGSVYVLSVIFFIVLIFAAVNFFNINLSAFLVNGHFCLGAFLLIAFLCLFQYAELNKRRESFSATN